MTLRYRGMIVYLLLISIFSYHLLVDPFSFVCYQDTLWASWIFRYGKFKIFTIKYAKQIAKAEAGLIDPASVFFKYSLVFRHRQLSGASRSAACETIGTVPTVSFNEKIEAIIRECGHETFATG